MPATEYRAQKFDVPFKSAIVFLPLDLSMTYCMTSQKVMNFEWHLVFADFRFSNCRNKNAECPPENADFCKNAEVEVIGQNPGSKYMICIQIHT